MAGSCRSWWRNCALEADAEILDIDRMENDIGPVSPSVSKIRELISSLELCHHKAERWIVNIIEAIGAGKTGKGLGTRSQDYLHPIEKLWGNSCAVLSAWFVRCPETSVNLRIDTVPASRIFSLLGERSPLKEWQVQRVIEKIRSVIHWPHKAAQYQWLLISASEYEFTYHSQCPPQYKEHEDFWLTTVRTIIHDTENGDDADLSLGLAIDMLWPCHWRFVENLQIILEAIGGKLNPEKSFAACGRNIILLPIRRRMEIVSNTLQVFCSGGESNMDVDRDLLKMLGKPTEVKKWFAASLDKTIRLQLNPPSELRAMSSLTCPEWIRRQNSS